MITVEGLVQPIHLLHLPTFYHNKLLPSPAATYPSRHPQTPNCAMRDKGLMASKHSTNTQVQIARPSCPFPPPLQIPYASNRNQPVYPQSSLLSLHQNASPSSAIDRLFSGLLSAAPWPSKPPSARERRCSSIALISGSMGISASTGVNVSFVDSSRGRASAAIPLSRRGVGLETMSVP